MVKIHNLGLPRIGQNRKLKFALEKYWKGAIDQEALLATGKSVRADNLALSSELDYLPVGDFSFYDQVLDTSFLLGAIPRRVKSNPSNPLDDYFRVARGQSASGCGCQVSASEMTKWFDTNYHYIVPELSKDSTFNLNAGNLLSQIKECRVTGANAKPVIIGPVTWLWLAKTTDDSDKLQLLDRLLPVYQQLLALLQKQGIEWLQIDEPALVTELSGEWQLAYRYAYNSLNNSNVKLLLTSYFGRLEDNLELVTRLPVAGVHIDVTRSGKEALLLAEKLEAEQVLSLGVIDGRNIWKSDLNRILEFVEPLAKQKPDKLWLAPSCSLLHVPLSLDVESELDTEVKQWLAFASEKLQELAILGKAINKGREAVCEALLDNLKAVQARAESKRIHNTEVAQAVASITPQDSERTSPFVERIRLQKERLDLPAFPTTTIGSFPQTTEIRRLRSAFKKGEIDPLAYRLGIRNEIQLCVETQESIGLDVLVHGEAERNDMVEYFGQQLNGFVFSQFGWVQSYGSRCVKPPMIFGDVSRPRNMTVEWIRYAQSLTAKQVKGMLTGPVTILNWSFVRDDIPRSETCRQIALAIRGEVLALEASGTNIIQIDEAALREGLPLRRSDWQAYLDWAVESFRLTANGVKDATQIHTHMCYSEFNDILEAIIALDADVITIENARSGDELLTALSEVAYPNHIGPGVYDIHSPNVPESGQITAKVQQMKNCIPAQNIWINPDCGLKTRQWQEVEPALRNMVQAAQQLRAEI